MNEKKEQAINSLYMLQALARKHPEYFRFKEHFDIVYNYINSK